MNDDLRNIDSDEVNRIRSEIESLLKVIKKIRLKYSVVKGQHGY